MAKRTIIQKAVEYEKLVPQKPNAVNFTVVEHFAELDPEKRFTIEPIFVPGFMYTSKKSPYAALQTDEEHKSRLQTAALSFLNRKKAAFIAGGCQEQSNSAISKVKALKAAKKFPELPSEPASAPNLVPIAKPAAKAPMSPPMRPPAPPKIIIATQKVEAKPFSGKPEAPKRPPPVRPPAPKK